MTITITEFADRIRHCWGRDTAYAPDKWTKANPAWGQCLVTTLIARDIFGGAIIKGEINGIEHYWNYIGGSYLGEVDLTREQFGAGPHSTKVLACTQYRDGDHLPPFQFAVPLLTDADLLAGSSDGDLERRYKLLRHLFAFEMVYPHGSGSYAL
jgi:hypothetical protein